MRVIVYARVSTTKQDLDRQLKLANDFCTVRGYQLVGQIVEKMSGTKSDRDGLKELMSLTQNDCDMVVVSELSRISREEEFQRIFSRIDTLRDNGISVVFLDDPDNVYSKENPITFVQFIMLGVRAQGARDELLKIRDRMKSGRVAKLKANPYMVTGSQVPFGFSKYANPDYVLGMTPKSLLRINEDEAAIIRLCYDMIISGKSCPAVADFLNRSGYIHNNNKGAKLWAAAEVNRLLRKRLYVGERVIEGVTHHIEPIVSQEVFEQAQKCMTANRCIISKDEERFNPLKGLLFCGDCGLSMMLVKNRGFLVYKCLYDAYKVRPNRTYKICHNSRVYFDKLIEIVWNTTINRLQSSEYYGASRQTVKDYEQQMTAIEKQMSKVIRERKPLTIEMNKRMKQLETITDVDIVELIEKSYKELKQRVEALNEQIRGLQKEHNKLNMKRSELATNMEIKRDMTIYEKSEFFHKVIERVTYNGEKFKKHGVIEIFYKNGDKVTIETANK